MILIESFRFWDEDDYEYEIFSILSSVHAWTSVILGGKCDSRRHPTTGFRENVVVTEIDYPMLEVLSFCYRERLKGAVSRKSSSFCLILPITRPQSLWNLNFKQRNYMEMTKSEIRDKQICLLSIIFEVASSRDQLWKTARLNSFQKS